MTKNLKEWKYSKIWKITNFENFDYRHKAVEIIKEQMEKEGETPMLYCMLGDATDDPKNYEKAIELSNKKSARAYRYVHI